MAFFLWMLSKKNLPPLKAKSLHYAKNDQIDQHTRQFWVTKEQVKANKYDLSVSRYRQGMEQDEYFLRETCCDDGTVTHAREYNDRNKIDELQGMLK